MIEVKLVKEENNLATVAVDLGADDVSRLYASVFAAYSQRLDVPGFRKGKIPRGIILNRVGEESVKMAVLDEVKERAYGKAVSELKLEPRRGEVTWQGEENIADGKPLALTVGIPTLPKFTLPDISRIKVEFTPGAVTDEMREKFRARLREKFTTFTDQGDAPAKVGDYVVFSVKSQFVESGGKAPFEFENVRYQLGADGNLPGFDEKIVGVKAGEEKEFGYTMPADYTNPEVSGKELLVTVKVEKVEKGAVPEFTPEFLSEKMKVKDESEFAEFIDKVLTDEVAEADRERKLGLAFKKISDECRIEVSDDMVHTEIDQIVRREDATLRGYESSLDAYLKERGTNIGAHREGLKAEAENRLKFHLIVRAISRAADLEATDDELRRKMVEFVRQNRVSQEQLKDLTKNRDFINDLIYDIVRDKVLAYVLATVQFTPGAGAPAAEPTPAPKATSVRNLAPAPPNQPEGGIKVV
jgi:trigger factor